jgi:hypothetical protein
MVGYERYVLCWGCLTTSTFLRQKKEIVRHGPSSLRLCTTLVHSQSDRPQRNFSSISHGKVVIDQVLDVVVIVENAAEIVGRRRSASKLLVGRSG